MKTDLTRRAFLSFCKSGSPGLSPADAASDLALSSYTFACAQVNEARPFLADEARRYKISTENRSDLEILRDVFAKAHQTAD